MKLIIKSIAFIALLHIVSCGKKEEPAPSLSAPLALNPSGITQNSFLAKWVRVSNAESYLLDVSANRDFSSFVDGYQSLAVNGVDHEVMDLEANTAYHYRLRAKSSSAESSNSNVVSLTTLIPEGIPLKDAAKNFYIGNIVQSNRLTGKHQEILGSEFSSISAEYEMKMNIMYPNEGAYNWTAADAIVNFAHDNGLNMHGHALIWHNATPDWVENYAGTDAEFEAMIEDYIKTVVDRYKDKVSSWDVVNEAILDGSGDYRNSVFYQRMGKDYITKCFQWAREADPDVVLFYNDYSICSDATKQSAIFTMIDELQNNSVPIDGLGYQLHISYNYPSRDDIVSAVNKSVDRNLKVHFSELDIRANPNNDLSSLTQSRSLAQKDKFKELAEIYSALPDDNKYALTLWGLKDDESWLLDFHGHIDWPLLYDASFNEKDAYYGFLEGLMKN